MLPFTKRPGRDESGESDVVTKDDLVKSPTVPPPPVSKRSVPPPAPGATAAGTPRAKFASINDEEMTTLMPTKSLGNAVPSVRPAAGAPPPSRASGVPSSRNSAPASAASASRSGKFAAMEEEEEDGRTVVRGAPKIVKRQSSVTGSSAKHMGMPTSPTTISPAAVIKATLESARGAVSKRGEHLMAPPPSDLLEDMADRMGEPHPADVGAEHTQILQSPSSSGSKSGSIAPPPMVQGVRAIPTQMLQSQQMPPSSQNGFDRSWTGPPPPMGHQANQSGPYNAQQSGGYAAMHNGPISSASVSVPGVAMPQSMPAHFMVPQAPYSDGRVDPPGTAVTARTKVAGRPAMSWAMALAAFGLFVGVGAVAVMHGNSDGGLMETSASFVDPSRAAAPKGAAAPGAPVADPVPATVGAPAAAVPAAAPPAPAPDAVAVAPVVTQPAAPPAAAPPVVVAVSPPPAPVATAPVAPPARTAVAQNPRPAPVSRPQRPAASPPEESAPAPAAEKPTRSAGKAAKPAAEMDDETKKALIELQKAQLERSLQ